MGNRFEIMYAENDLDILRNPFEMFRDCGAKIDERDGGLLVCSFDKPVVREHTSEHFAHFDRLMERGGEWNLYGLHTKKAAVDYVLNSGSRNSRLVVMNDDNPDYSNDLSGAQATEILRNSGYEGRIVVYDLFTHQERTRELIEAGADAVEVNNGCIDDLCKIFLGALETE